MKWFDIVSNIIDIVFDISVIVYIIHTWKDKKEEEWVYLLFLCKGKIWTGISEIFKKVKKMLYMIIEKYKDKEAVYKRFHEKGRMMPDGVSYVNSCVTEDGNTCYQINEAESLELLHKWASNWNDVADFTFIPVISSHEMSEKMKK